MHPRFLGHLLGQAGVADIVQSQAHEHRVMLLHEPFEGAFIAAPQRADNFGLILAAHTTGHDGVEDGKCNRA